MRHCSAGSAHTKVVQWLGRVKCFLTKHAEMTLGLGVRSNKVIPNVAHRVGLYSCTDCRPAPCAHARDHQAIRYTFAALCTESCRHQQLMLYELPSCGQEMLDRAKEHGVASLEWVKAADGHEVGRRRRML